ncbi:MAG: DOPA 4,5-dioxygenase family protein [Alphaproteobacteria bacterium]|nr:DOPA 4,5-dioxygenase family protein [Alphaproteobacteria bacterium]
MASEDAPSIKGYHAHVYFDAATREKAWVLRDTVGKAFPAAQIGRFHEQNVGPHPRWSFQIAFAPDQFDRIVPWLMLNREGLTVFLHPETGDDLPDHAERAIWMGELLPLNLDALRGG